MILNLTQHPATPEQIAAGVTDLRPAEMAALKEALDFKEIPTIAGVEERVAFIAELAAQYDMDDGDQEGQHASQAMIGGALYLMAPLQAELQACGIEPLYAFSRRVSEEQTQVDGSVRKVNVFRHIGFVSAV